KQAHASHKAKNVVSTTKYLELLHMDLFGPSAVRSYRGNRYTLVIVDDYSRPSEGMQTFMDRFKSESSHIKAIPLVLRILAFMHGHGHPELAKKLNNKIPKTVDEMFEMVRAFIRGEVAAGLATPSGLILTPSPGSTLSQFSKRHRLELQKAPQDFQTSSPPAGLDSSCPLHVHLPSCPRNENQGRNGVKVINMINGGRNRKRPYEVERSGFTEELTFPAIPRNRLTNEPIILEGTIEGHHVRRIHIDKGRSSEIMFLKRSIPSLGFGRPSGDHERGRKKQNSANGIRNSKVGGNKARSSKSTSSDEKLRPRGPDQIRRLSLQLASIVGHYKILKHAIPRQKNSSSFNSHNTLSKDDFLETPSQGCDKWSDGGDIINLWHWRAVEIRTYNISYIRTNEAEGQMVNKFLGQKELMSRMLNEKDEGMSRWSKKLQAKLTPTPRAWRLYLSR
ncbi:reverse transcriptase domain-containing protein, partial [Tanacetum coccineum]